MKTITKIQVVLAIASFIAGTAFGIAGFIVPPEGEIHDSVLYLIAQFFLLTASLFGVGALFSTRYRKGVDERPAGIESLSNVPSNSRCDGTGE